MDEFLDYPPAWWDDAACADLPQEYFFLPVAMLHKRQQEPYAVKRAKAVCAGCSVVAQCLEAGMSGPSLQHGIFGAKTPRERQALARQRAALEPTSGDAALRSQTR